MRLSRLSLFIISVFSAASPYAAWAADACTFESQKLCSAFDTNSDRIDFGDYTFIPNYRALALPDEDLATRVKLTTANKNQDAEDMLDLKIQVSHLLAVAKPPLSDESLYFFSEHIDVLRQVLSGSFFEFNIPWPLTGTSHIQTVSRDDASAQIKSLFTAVQLAALGRATDGFSNQKFKIESRPPGAFSSHGQQLLNDMNTVSDQRFERVEELFAQAKKSVEGQIRAGRKDDALSSNEMAAIRKVESVALNPYRRDVDRDSSCLSIFPNAYYSSVSHTVSVCKNMMNFPDESLVGVLAHEIGHSVDVCQSQFGLFSVHQSALQTLKKKVQSDPDNQHYKAVQVIIDSTYGNGPDGLTQTAAHLNRILDSPQLSFLEDAGALKRISDDVAFSNYIFKDVYQCLMTPGGGAFRHETQSDIDRIVKTVVDQRKATQGTKYDAKVDSVNLRKAFTLSPECGLTDAHSNMAETMADWFGANAMDDYLTAAKPKVRTGDLAKFAPIAIKLYEACGDLERPRARAPHSPAEIVDAAVASKEESEDVHPSASKRLNDIFLRDPVVRETLGCKPASISQKPCMHSAGLQKIQKTNRETKPSKALQ